MKAEPTTSERLRAAARSPPGVVCRGGIGAGGNLGRLCGGAYLNATAFTASVILWTIRSASSLWNLTYSSPIPLSQRVTATQTTTAADTSELVPGLLSVDGTDSTAPIATIISGPTGSTTNTRPAFGFTSNEANSQFVCRFDSGRWAACNGGSYRPPDPLLPGSHTFSVKAIDVAANLGAVARRSFTVTSWL